MASEIKANIRAIADTIKDNIKLDNHTGVFTVAADLVTEKLMPEGLTAEQFKASLDHVDNVMAGSRLAFGEVSIDAMKKHKKLETTQIEIPLVGKNNYSATMTRSKEVTDLKNPSGPKMTVHGSIREKLELSCLGNGGELGKVHRHLKNLAKEALAD